MRKEYDFSNGVRNPYAKMLKRLSNVDDLRDLQIIDRNADRLNAEAEKVLGYQVQIRIGGGSHCKKKSGTKSHNLGSKKKKTD